MAETRSQSRAKELNPDRLTPIEDGEVPETASSNQSRSLEAVALDQLNTSASLLGYTPQDIEAFLQRRLPAVELPPTNIPIDMSSPIVVPRVRDPSLSKPPDTHLTSSQLLTTLSQSSNLTMSTYGPTT